MSDNLKNGTLASQQGVAKSKVMGLCAVIAVALITSWFFVKNEPSGIREPSMVGYPPTVRRLDEEQYIRSIHYIFGKDIDVPGRFDPPVREGGLMAIGSSGAVVTSAGLERNLARAQRIANQVMSEEKRQEYLPCEPEVINGFSEQCATDFFNKYGRLLFRRPVNEAELDIALVAAREATEVYQDFYKGMEHGLVSILISPAFMYRIESAEADPGEAGQHRLDAYSLASRISFLLWDAPPDEELLDIAESGKIFDHETLQGQFDRMVASPRFEEGVRAFFIDNFSYDRFHGLVKDSSIFPLFSPQLRDDAEEQSLRTIVNHLVVEGGDYRELFTTNKTFMNRNLGALFRVPVNVREYGEWVPYTFEEGQNRMGLLTLPAFLMLDPNHEGRSSPTIRGKVVREQYFCQAVPSPPGDVDFDSFESHDNPLKTARERLARHNEDPVCSGCHEVTDPIGLAFENWDAVGQFRTHENTALIDPSGNLEGVAFDDGIELQQVISENEALTRCLAQRVYEYGVGKPLRSQDFNWMDYTYGSFSDNDYNFIELLRHVAMSRAFRVVMPENVTRS